MINIKCGESYDEGVCEGCGLAERHCPMRSDGLRLELVNYRGEALRSTTIGPRSLEALAADLDAFVWLLQPDTYAVRVHWANRMHLVRRPAEAVAALNAMHTS